MEYESTTAPEPRPLDRTTIVHARAEIGDGSAASEPRQSAANTVKPQHYSRKSLAAPHVLVIMACLAYVAAIMTFGIGLHNISVYLKPQVEVAQLELQVQMNLKYREQALHIRLDKVMDTQLSRNFLDTYDDCLVRGITEVDQQLFGLGFQYPDIRDRSID